MAAELPKAFGRYVLLERLGAGAMGDAYLARAADAGPGAQPLVIKRLHARLTSEEQLVRRFKHEADIARAIDSPYVAKVYDAGVADDTLYIAMEYVAGWPVHRVTAELEKHGQRMSIASAVDLVACGLKGVQALNDAVDPRTGVPLGIVHRDISPKNMIVGVDGRTRLIDLGIGKSNIRDWQTRTGAIVGSPGYMPPEQVLAEAVDERADLYAIGVVLYELLTWTHYVTPGPVARMLRDTLSVKFTPPSAYRPEIPAGLDSVLEKALQKEKSARWANAREFLAALRMVVPERAEESSMRSLVGDMLWNEASERTTVVTKLMATLTPPPPDTAVRPVALKVPPAPRRWVTPLALAVTLLGGIGIGRVIYGPSESPSEPAPSVPVAAPIVETKPAIVPRAAPEPEAPKSSPPVPITKRVAPLAKVTKPEPVVVEEAPAPELTFDQKLAKMLDQTRAIVAKQKKAGEDSSEAERLLRDILLEQPKTEHPNEQQTLERFQRALEKLQ